MKDVIKTLIVVLIVVFIFGIYTNMSGNIKHGVELFTRTNLASTDPTINLLMTKVESIEHLRRAKLVNKELTSEEIIEFTLDNLTENDFTQIVVESIKIVCTVNDYVKFNSSNPVCQLTVINNDIFMKYQKEYFNTEIELDYKDIKYHGFYCKNDGKKYYCQREPYSSSIINYSLFESAYEEKDKIVLRGYYLRIDLTNQEKCLSFINEEYCSNYNNMSKPTLSEEVIKENGCLYEHVFRKVNDTYYLESSYLVTE